MADKLEIDDVIASRALELVLENGEKEEFLVNIAKPKPVGKDYICEHEISSADSSEVVGIYGIDSIQALELSIKSIASYLEFLERKRNGKFYYLGEPGHCF